MTGSAGRATATAAPRRVGCLGVTGLIALAAVTVVGMEYGCRAVEAPWSFGMGGRPTLTGIWEGPRRARLGTEYRLYVALAYESSDAASRRYGLPDNLGGEARLCSPAGDMWVYRLRGRATRSGDVLSLDLWTPSAGPPMPTPGRIEGTWDGASALTIAGGYNPLLPDGTFAPSRVVSSADPDDSFVPATLGRGDLPTFEANCRRLRRDTR